MTNCPCHPVMQVCGHVGDLIGFYFLGLSPPSFLPPSKKQKRERGLLKGAGMIVVVVKAQHKFCMLMISWGGEQVSPLDGFVYEIKSPARLGFFLGWRGEGN